MPEANDLPTSADGMKDQLRTLEIVFKRLLDDPAMEDAGMLPDLRSALERLRALLEVSSPFAQTRDEAPDLYRDFDVIVRTAVEAACRLPSLPNLRGNARYMHIFKAMRYYERQRTEALMPEEHDLTAAICDDLSVLAKAARHEPDDQQVEAAALARVRANQRRLRDIGCASMTVRIGGLAFLN